MRIKGWQFRHWPIAYKLAIVFSLLLTAIVVVVGLVSYHLSRQAMETQIKNYIPQVLDQVNVRLEDYVNDVKSLSQMVLLEPYSGLIEEALNGFEQSGPERRLENTIKLHEALSFITFNPSKEYVVGLFYTHSGQVYVRQSAGGIWLDAAYEEQQWYGDMDVDHFTPTVLGTIQFKLFGDNLFIGDYDAFSVVQPIRRPNSKALSGILQIVGTLETIQEIMRGIDFGTNSKLYVVDHRNRIVFASDQSLLGKEWVSAYGADWSEERGSSGSNIQTMDGQQMLVSYNRSDASGWKVVGVIPLQNVSQEVNQVKTWIVAWIALGILGVILLSAMLSISMTNPLRRLIRLSRRQVDLFAPSVHAGQVGNDEIGQLEQAYRQMMKRIQVLLNEVLEEKLLHQDAEIRALQSQINPHFLHNALETIRMTIRKGNTRKGEHALVALGQLLRYHAASINERVQVKTEMDFIQNYLSIQQLRFGDRLSVKTEVDDGLMEVPIPSLLLQPLVENAITHSASPYDHRIRVTVRLKRQGDYMICYVIDEGKGIPPDNLNDLMKSLQQNTMRNERHDGRRIGLKNVYHRIQLIYGNQAEFYIESIEGAGTIVSVYIPLAGEWNVTNGEISE
ncbi:sensor histidine kinase [Paenibacillus sp. GCM10027626]|uniref:sensor histidine kinase n=1 Tax=Paenibacillus sp. GCM10027626 TaxID=3273411 RepID=UPI0036411626